MTWFQYTRMDKAQINWLRQEAIQDGSIPNKLGFKVFCLGLQPRHGLKTVPNNLKPLEDDNEWWPSHDFNHFESSRKSKSYLRGNAKLYQRRIICWYWRCSWPLFRIRFYIALQWLQWLVHDLVMLRNLPKGLNLLDVFVFSGTVMRLSGQKMLEAMNYIFRGQLLKSNRLSRQRTKRHVKSRYPSNVRSYQANHHSFTCNRCLQAAYVELYN